MKKRFFLFATLALAMGLTFTSCGDDESEDACSSEIGDIGDSYSCNVPVMPQICTVDGVDDHWILDGVEYDCPNSDCTTPPSDMVEAILALDGCGSKKSVDLAAANVKISKKAEVILANLKMETTLCSN